MASDSKWLVSSPLYVLPHPPQILIYCTLRDTVARVVVSGKHDGHQQKRTDVQVYVRLCTHAATPTGQMRLFVDRSALSSHDLHTHARDSSLRYLDH